LVEIKEKHALEEQSLIIYKRPFRVLKYFYLYVVDFVIVLLKWLAVHPGLISGLFIAIATAWLGYTLDGPHQAVRNILFALLEYFNYRSYYTFTLKKKSTHIYMYI